MGQAFDGFDFEPDDFMKQTFHISVTYLQLGYPSRIFA